jgi:hypothetical protein
MLAFLAWLRLGKFRSYWKSRAVGENQCLGLRTTRTLPLDVPPQ